MRRTHSVAALAVLCAALAGWVALAWAQPSDPGKLPPVQGPATSGAKEPAPLAGPQLPPPSATPDGPAATGPGITPAVTPTTDPKTLPAPVPIPEVAQPVSPATTTPLVTTPVAPSPVPATDDREDLGPGATPANPTGRQEPAVSLEWIGPPVAKIGRPADYTIVVRNVCPIAVQQVMVRVRTPAGMSVTATEPKAVSEANVLMWELGTLMPKQEKNLTLRMVPDNKGNLGAQAWVTFTGSTSTRIRVCEPKLVLKAQAPEKVMIGDAATFVLTVSNPGDGPVDQVRIHANLSEGLEYPHGKSVDFDNIGTIPPGESRSVQVICGTKAGGMQYCDATAEADGDLKAQDKAAVNVIMPRLLLEASGPKLRYLDRKATYTFKVTNPGDASATNVTVNDVIPPGFKFTGADSGGRHDFSTRTVSWFLGELAPAQSKEVHLEVVAVNPGEFRHKATAQAARGLKEDGEVMTKVIGLSAILLEVVDTDDPIEVGAQTSYEIRITNTGSATETDVKLLCTIPEKMQFVNAQGPSRFHQEGANIVFDVLPRLAPRADAIYRVTVKAMAPGDVRFKTQITSTNLVEPVHEEEATRIYADQ
jgi:uncharacterized repeat protein (TIGR01451 family)